VPQRKVGMRSCKELREAPMANLFFKRASPRLIWRRSGLAWLGDASAAAADWRAEEAQGAQPRKAPGLRRGMRRAGEAAALDSGALPALTTISLDRIPASAVVKEAVHAALANREPL
jgi:hypothetical protein